MTVSHGYETDRVSYRPVLRGRQLMVASGHYLGSMAGMRMLALGGNAIDAGVAAVFTQVLIEFQSAGFGGECPILIYSARDARVAAINGNCRAPAAATIERYRDLGLGLIPDDGFLSAGVCATAGALITALDLYGTLSLREVLAPAIELASDGFPMYDALRSGIGSVADRIRDEWPSSAKLFLDRGALPPLGAVMRNPELARTYEKLVEAEHTGAAANGRSAGLRAAYERFYSGDIAERIVEFQRDTTTRHAGGVVSSGLLTRSDFAKYRTRIEASATVDYKGLMVHKCGPWSQGPVFLQQLRLLEHFELSRMGAGSADYIHTIVECAKLAFADREAYYGDPDFVRVPLTGLLSREYATERSRLIDPRRAATDVTAGDPFRHEGTKGSTVAVEGRPWPSGTTGTRAVDRAGNMFSATPSGGWLRSSPVIPGLGFALGSRLQAFWLDPEHPDALMPGKQPRTTLTPTLVTKEGRAYLGFGSPGGDQQDQWSLQFFLNVIEFGMDIQDAVDEPAFQSEHAPSSFYPRESMPMVVRAESTIGQAVLGELESRGHVIHRARPWSLGNVTAVRREEQTGELEASATSRGQKAYAIGW